MSTVNADLLAAAKKYRGEYCRDGDPCRATGYELEQAIAAAESELAERKLPIDADSVRALGFRFNLAYQRHELRISSETRLDITPQFDYLTIYQGPVEAVGFELKNKGQLLDLLSGLGIEVAK